MPESLQGVVVVGTGAAGLSAAVAAAEHAPVTVLTDRAVGRSNSVHAQGGLQRPGVEPDAEASMIADIQRSAREPVDVARVERIVSSTADVIDRLRHWGVPFDLDGSGAYEMHMAGGLTRPRIVSAGDRIGPAVMRVLTDRTRSLTNIDVRPWTTVVGISRVSTPGYRLDIVDRGGIESTLLAGTVVVATGGTAHEHAKTREAPTTNPPNANGAMAEIVAGLGVEAPDRFSFQMHPFGIVASDRDGVVRCAPERITRLGVELTDAEHNPIIGPDADRLAILEAHRDAAREGRLVADGGTRGMVLGLASLPPEEISTSFPGFASWLAARGLVGEDLVVDPAFHYQLGGFSVTPEGSTNLPGLFLAGEITGGVHGKNRLMGMGLTQSLVEGRLAGRAAAGFSRR